MEALGAATLPGCRKCASERYGILIVIAALIDLPVRQRAAA
jgi:hypothetical protein